MPDMDMNIPYSQYYIIINTHDFVIIFNGCAHRSVK